MDGGRGAGPVSLDSDEVTRVVSDARAKAFTPNGLTPSPIDWRDV